MGAFVTVVIFLGVVFLLLPFGLGRLVATKLPASLVQMTMPVTVLFAAGTVLTVVFNIVDFGAHHPPGGENYSGLLLVPLMPLTSILVGMHARKGASTALTMIWFAVVLTTIVLFGLVAGPNPILKRATRSSREGMYALRQDVSIPKAFGQRITTYKALRGQ